MVLPGAAVHSSLLLLGKEIVLLNLNDSNFSLAPPRGLVTAEARAWTRLFLVFCCEEVRDDQQAAGEAQDDQSLTGSHRYVPETLLSLSRVVTVVGGDELLDRDQLQDGQSYPPPLQSGAELQVERHLEVTDCTRQS